MPDKTTTTLYRPVGPAELALIQESGWRAYPPRLPGQPIFYPVLNEEYARRIAEGWNRRDDGGCYVTRFEIDTAFVSRYPVQRVGSSLHLELWVPAGELDDFNRHIVGQIEVVADYRTGGPGGITLE
jgi:hypothetical protein